MSELIVAGLSIGYTLLDACQWFWGILYSRETFFACGSCCDTLYTMLADYAFEVHVHLYTYSFWVVDMIHLSNVLEIIVSRSIYS